MVSLSLFSTVVIDALGWALLHSVWQASLIGLLLFIILPRLKEKEANIRYHLSYAALLLIFAGAISTFLFYLTGDVQLQSNNSLINPSEKILNPGDLSNSSASIIQIIQENLDIVAFVWMLGMVFYFLKFGLGLYEIQLYKRQSTPASNTALMSIFETLKKQFNIKRHIDLRFSHDFAGPFVSGWLKPIVFFPIELCCQLTPDQSKDILAHEIAHIMRHDFVVNLTQVLIENIFYFHPVVWWVSATIRKEREIACDEFAIRASGYDRVHYAKSLLSLGQLSNKRSPNLSLSAKGHKNDLFNRISNLLGEKPVNNQMKEKIIASVLMLGVALVVFGFRTPIEMTSLLPIQNDFEEIIIIDTLPPGIKSQTKTIELKNGKVQRLVIDGKEIPKSEYDTYDIIVEKSGPDHHQEIITKLNHEIRIHFDSIPEMVERFDVDFAELKDMAHDVGDAFIFHFDSLDSDRKYFEFQFDFDSLQQNFEIHQFDKEKLHEHLEKNEEHLYQWLHEYKENVKQLLKENEWVELEQLRNFEWDSEAWKVQQEIMQEKFKELGEEGRLKLNDLRWHMEQPFMEKFNENELYFMTPEMRFFPSSSFEDKIFQQLKIDGYLKEGLNTLVITGKVMKVNGKKVDDANYQKYKQKFEQQLGGEMDKQSKIKIKRYFNKERAATPI